MFFFPLLHIAQQSSHIHADLRKYLFFVFHVPHIFDKLIRQGDTLIRQGDILIRQGDTLIRQGEKTNKQTRLYADIILDLLPVFSSKRVQ